MGTSLLATRNMAPVFGVMLPTVCLVIFLPCFLAEWRPYGDITSYKKEYALLSLPYEYGALEPFIDEATMRVHHTGHHAAYTKKLNAALRAWRTSGENKELASKSIVEILKSIEDIPEKWRVAVKNNGGGFVNHALFWSVMSPNPNNEDRQPRGKVAELIDSSYGNFTLFQKAFTDVASSLFGSGYVWLYEDADTHYLHIVGMVNQDCPVTFGISPVLVLDMWEHAYYLKNQNRRGEYIKSWWNVVNWDAVNELFDWWSKQNYRDEL